MSRKKLFVFAFVLIFFPGPRSFAQNALEGAEFRIQSYRTRKVTIRLIDEQGRPLPEFRVRAVMKRHQFLFGCNLLMFGLFPSPEQNQRYQELFAKLFNYGTVPFYLSGYEPVGGMRERAPAQKIAEWAAKNRIALKGHPLIWHDLAGNPGWLPGDPIQLDPVIKDLVVDTVLSFKNGIQYWDVINEPTVAWNADTPVAKWENTLGPAQASAKALSWARDANPQAQFLVNDYNIFALPALGRLISHPENMARLLADPVKHYPVSYYLFIARLKSDQAGLDAIGLQSHMHRGNWPIEQVRRLCERYSRLGLPLHFTEVTVLSGEHKQSLNMTDYSRNQPWPSTPEGEQEQADYVEKLYRLLFSHPALEAITWWDLSDQGAWLFAPGGLVRGDLSPKPVYEKLYHLIQEEWRTDFEGDTDKNGELGFRGFCGDYQLELTGRAEPVSFAIDCKAENNQKLEITIKR